MGTRYRTSLFIYGKGIQVLIRKTTEIHFITMAGTHVFEDQHIAAVFVFIVE
jgi:ascorbate-specific PTS system EIIC-type component UlaA